MLSHLAFFFLEQEGEGKELDLYGIPYINHAPRTSTAEGLHLATYI